MSTKKLPTSRRTFVKGTAASAAIAPFFIGRSAKAAEPDWTLTLGTVAPRDTPWGGMATRISKLMTEKTGGKVKLKTFFGGSRGTEQTVAASTAAGTMAIFAGSFGGLGKIIPELGVFELPFIMSSAKQGRKVVDANRTLIHDLLWERGFKLMMFSENGSQDIGTTRPVEKPSDMKGLKIRTLESQVHIDTVEATGATAVPMGVTEVLPSLQTGVIDGLTNTALFATAANWTSGLADWTVTHHCWQPAVVAMSRLVWEKLPAEIQEAMGLESAELAKIKTRTDRKLDAMAPQLLQNIADLGITVHKPDLAPWKTIAGKVQAKFDKRTTKYGRALLKGIKKAT
ncbi:MAG: TRAP transporter substrate-binding protein [Nannocystales bacterium]